MLCIGADSGTDEALADREAVYVHLQLVGQSGDGTGVASGEQLAANDALVGNLLHQGAVVTDDVVILPREAELYQIAAHPFQGAARGKHHCHSLGAGGGNGCVGAG